MVNSPPTGAVTFTKYVTVVPVTLVPPGTNVGTFYIYSLFLLLFLLATAPYGLVLPQRGEHGTWESDIDLQH